VHPWSTECPNRIYYTAFGFIILKLEAFMVHLTTMLATGRANGRTFV
jgi:hypothetical protein